MFAEYFHSDANQNQSTDEVDVDLEPTAELDAYHAADYGDDKAAEGYQRGSERKDVAARDEQQACGEGVDAVGNGEDDEHLQRSVRCVFRLLLVAFETLDDHLSADETENAEGYPVVVCSYDVDEIDSDRPSYDWHKTLEATEEEGYEQYPWPVVASVAD